jgi:hypothetical protein
VATPVTVRAVVAPDAGPDVLAAIERQTRPPEETLVLRDGQPVVAALEGPADWLWLLDGSVVPGDEALARLLAIGEDPGGLPPPGLLASKVELADGSFDPSFVAVAQVGDRDVAIGAFERGAVSLRVVGGGSLLVAGTSLDGSRLDPFADELEWSARLLRRVPGLLVPDSVAVRVPLGPRDARKRERRELRERLSLLLGDAIETREKAWFALRLAEDTLAHLRRGAA